MRIVALSLLTASLLSTASGVRAQEQVESEHLFAVAIGTHVDGSTSYSHQTYGAEAGRLSSGASIGAADRSSQLLPPNFQFSPALVETSSRWSSSATKLWTWAEQAQGAARQIQRNLAKIKAAAQQAHVRKGNSRMPRFMQTNGRIPVRNIPNPQRDLTQFQFDGKNTVIRTVDNRFIRALFPGRFDITSVAFLHFRIICSPPAGGLTRCTSPIVECDLYVRARSVTEPGFFEDTTVRQQRQALAASYKQCYGHQGNVWGHDLNGSFNREVNQQSFNANNRRVWPLERQEDNRLYGPGGGPALPARWIFPRRDAVIDYGFLEIPTLIRELTEQSYAALFNAFFLTNLKGYNGGKNLRFWVYEGNSTLPKDRILGPLGGFADRSLTSIVGRRAIRDYLMSYVHLGRRVHWNKLGTRLIRPENQGKSVRGIPYDYVMRITVKASGFLAENGPRQMVTERYWLVYNEGERTNPEPIPFVR